jgi:hypothetical protein
VAALLVEPSLLQPLKQTGEEVQSFLVVVEVHFLFYLRFISLTFNTYPAPKGERRENGDVGGIGVTTNLLRPATAL